MTASTSDVYNANNNGPNTLPCGTPDDSAHVSDLSEPSGGFTGRARGAIAPLDWGQKIPTPKKIHSMT